MRPGAIQVAGIHDAEEAALLVECGVDFLGFPLGLERHREDCTDAEAAGIVAGLRGRVEAVLITYLREPDAIADLARRIGAGWAQLHGDIAPDAVARLRETAPELRLCKSLVVRGHDPAGLEEALWRYTPWVDAFLTDTFDPATGASGATGKVHDWRVSRALADCSTRSLVLAGGLTPENVARAIRAVRPAAVDAHTGVEGPDGRKQRDRVARFVAEARAAFAEVPRGEREAARPPE
jgi:phosphoribosylanthranilate isomerase